MIEIPYTEMEWVWINSHYDVHLSGLCRVRGKLYRFSNAYPEDEEPMICQVYTLSPWGKIRWLWPKRKFEICVGYHWTYPQRSIGERFYIRRPRWLFKLLFSLHYKSLAAFRVFK